MSLVEPTIRRYEAILRSDGQTIGPAPEGEIAAADDLCRTLVGRPLPAQILQIWSRVNSIGYGGTTIFGPHESDSPFYQEGLIEENEQNDVPEGFVLIGTSDDEWIGWNATEDACYLIDKFGEQPLPLGQTFDQLFSERIAAPVDIVYQDRLERGDL